MDDCNFYKLIFLVLGNVSKWIYFGGRKSIDEISREDNFTLGLIVSMILVFLIFFNLK